ncbi:HTH_Tnp_Tc3_2 domain-containing protein [Trichonephila clavipes]|nr:HTH_Tnp_Tc3_2 domain-containing protein [Trichonephila clavipes]
MSSMCLALSSIKIKSRSTAPVKRPLESTIYGRTQRYVFARGTVTAPRYRDEVLEPYVRLFTGTVGPDFILMNNNAKHIELVWTMSFEKMRIFIRWIGQLDLQTSAVYSIPGMLWGRQL